MRRLTLPVIVLCALACALACALQAADRVALVIGNSSYQNLPQLPACQRDAKLMADIFAYKLGIRIHGGKPLMDLTAGQMDDALHAFAATLGPETEAYLYYSGHGVQADGVNYLLPVDYSAKYKVQLRRQAVSLDDVLSVLEDSRAKLRVIILDSCRSPGEFLPGEPGEKGFSRKGGLAEQKVENPDTLVCFATKHGTPAFSPDASDLTGASLYTSVLAQEILKPGNIEDVLKRVAIGVYAKTEQQQLPFTYGSLLHNFSFLSGSASVPVIATAPVPTVPVMPAPVVPPPSVMGSGEGSIRIESTPPGCRFTLSMPDPQLDALKRELSATETRYAVKGLSKGENATLKSRIADLKSQIPNFRPATPPRSGITPMNVTGLAVGTWRLVISREGWLDYERSLSIAQGVNPKIDNEFGEGTVNLISDPPGCEVYLGKRLLGRTPCEAKVPSGLNLFTLVGTNGYSQKSISGQIPLDGLLTLNEKLEKASFAGFLGKWSFLHSGNIRKLECVAKNFDQHGQYTEFENSVKFYLSNDGELAFRLINSAETTDTWRSPNDHKAERSKNSATIPGKAYLDDKFAGTYSAKVSFDPASKIMTTVVTYDPIDQAQKKFAKEMGPMVTRFALDPNGQKLVRFGKDGSITPQSIEAKINDHLKLKPLVAGQNYCEEQFTYATRVK